MKSTREDCLKAIEALVLGDAAENITNSRIDPEPDVTYLSFKPRPEKGYGRNLRFGCQIRLNEEYGHVHCVIDAGSIKIVTNPKDLQEAYEYVKAWVLKI